jgi:hypothetical protein
MGKQTQALHLRFDEDNRVDENPGVNFQIITERLKTRMFNLSFNHGVNRSGP